MKVLLISANTATDPYPVYPLGLSVIMNALREAGHDVDVFDFLRHHAVEPLAAKAAGMQPDLVGISIRNIDNTNAAHELRYLDIVEQIVETIRLACRAPVVLGGSGFSIMPEAILQRVDADYGVVGEGEELILELIRQLESGKPPAEKILHAGTKLVDAGIAGGAYDAELLQYYVNSEGITPIQTKRGCDRHCVYCTYPILEGHCLRPRDPHAVVDDIEALMQNHGVRQVFFVDSVFNDADGCYRQLVEAMHARDVCVPWTAFFSPGREVDDEIVALMQETGLESAEIGADATTDTTLAALRKGFTFADVIAMNDCFRRHEITTTHSFMFAGPDETPETVEQGIENLCSLKETASFIFMGIRILPGTPLWKRAVEEDVIKADDDLLDSVYYFSPALDRDELEKRLTEAFADRRDIIFPPDAINAQLQFLHRMKRLGAG